MADRRLQHARVYRLPGPAHLEVVYDSIAPPVAEVEAFISAHYPVCEAACEALPSGSPHWRLSFQRDTEPLAVELSPAAMAFSAEPHGRTPELRVYPSTHGACLVEDREARVSMLWRLDTREIVIRPAANVDRRALVEATYTTMRTLGFRVLAELGAELIHAAAICRDGKAVLLLGEKGSGKTTLTTALLAKGCSFLASDRTLVWPDREQGRPRAAGWACTFRLHRSSFALLFAGATRARFEALWREHGNQPGWQYGGKLRCPPGLFLELMHARACFEAELDRVITVLPDAGPARLEPEPEPWTESLARHRVLRDLPPPLAVDPVASGSRPGPPVQNLRLRGRDRPELMAELIC